MRRYDFWKLCLLNIVAAPTRSALTVLGMAIGIGAILAVLTLGDAGKNQVRSEMTRLGIDRVWLTAAEGERLVVGDGFVLEERLNAIVTEQTYAPVALRLGEATVQGVAVGCSDSYLRLMGTQVLKGRELLPLEWRSGTRSMLLGRDVAAALSAAPGSIVSLDGMPLRCVGIVAQDNGLSRIDADTAAFVPMALMEECFGSTVHELTLSVPDSMEPQVMATMATDTLRAARHVETTATTMQVQIEAANSVMTIFIDVLKWVALICILVGGIGVMNILLVSVRERRREIGVMKAMGATSRQICSLFLLEALIYAAAGGLLGLAVGCWLIDTAGASIGLRPTLQAAHCCWVLLAALGVGLCSGVLPASRAAGLHPIDALRDE